MLPSYEPLPERPRVRVIDVVLPVCVALVLVMVSFGFRNRCVTKLGDLNFSVRNLCYTDVYALYGAEGLNQGRVPYFDQRPDGKYVEFPVLTGAWMYATSQVATLFVGENDRGSARGYSAYFWINQAGFGLLILVTAGALGALVGWKRALLFAAAPTLILHGGVSWDMLAVAPFILALLAYSRARDGTAGFLIGVGAAAKLFPIFALPFLVVQRLRERAYKKAALIGGAGVGTLVAINVPVAIGAPKGWWEFFRLNSERAADWDSIWYHITQTWRVSFQTPRLNLVTAFLFAAGAAGLLAWMWWRQARPEPDAFLGLRQSTATAMFLVVFWFLIVNKVWSPQYGIWLLPFWSFAVPLPFAALVVAWGVFQAMEVFVFVTRFWMFARKVTYPWFRAAIFVRLAGAIALMSYLLSRRRNALPSPEPVADEALV